MCSKPPVSGNGATGASPKMVTLIKMKSGGGAFTEGPPKGTIDTLNCYSIFSSH